MKVHNLLERITHHLIKSHKNHSSYDLDSITVMLYFLYTSRSFDKMANVCVFANIIISVCSNIGKVIKNQYP